MAGVPVSAGPRGGCPMSPTSIPASRHLMRLDRQPLQQRDQWDVPIAVRDSRITCQVVAMIGIAPRLQYSPWHKTDHPRASPRQHLAKRTAPWGHLGSLGLAAGGQRLWIDVPLSCASAPVAQRRIAKGGGSESAAVIGQFIAQIGNRGQPLNSRFKSHHGSTKNRAAGAQS